MLHRKNNTRTLNLNHIPIESLFSRYQRLVLSLPKRLRWLAYVLAPAGTSFVVFSAGLATILGSLTITVSIEQITSNQVSASAAYLLIFAFFTEAVGYWIKERQEALLAVTVRHLTYRRFHRIFMSSSPTSESRKHVLTYPAQISQFAFIVDFAVSTVQIFAFLVVSFSLYGMSGAVATLFIAGMVFISVKLIHLVGCLWEKYVDLEGKRRHWIQRVADTLPRGRAIPSWKTAIDTIAGIRSTEEGLLRKRVSLQVTNGFLEKGALTFVLALVAILSALLWPSVNFSISIILAARYLYAAVQNNVVNYRVIRLAIPMMRELDKLEGELTSTNNQHVLIERPLLAREVLPSTSERAESIRNSVFASDVAFVPLNPEVSKSVLTVWKAVSPERTSRFIEIARNFALTEEVITRFWEDPTTLSSGERHRASVAIVLAENPNWLILDDTFASLDPETRELVSKIVLAHVPNCTLLASSEEYVPKAFLASQETDYEDLTNQQSLTSKVTDGSDFVLSPNETKLELPSPDPKDATFRRSLKLLFGSHVIWIAIGAVLLSGAQVAFALTISSGNMLSTQTTVVSAICAVATVIGSLMFFIPLYRTPISRLSSLHSRIVKRLDKFACPRTSGATVGRLGEDFSDLQMSVPSALGSVFLVITQTVLLIGGAVAGAPLFLIVVLAVAPLTILAMRQGSKRILPTSTEAANLRGEFLGVVGTQANLRLAPASKGLYLAGKEAYTGSEADYINGSINLANAYAFRTGLIQMLVLTLNISAVLLVLLAGNSNPFVTPAAVIYFAVTLASGIQSTVETLQEVGVVGLTTERVQILEKFQLTHYEPIVHTTGINQLKRMLSAGHAMIALIGSTGTGKSLILNALFKQYPEGEVAVIPDVDPFSHEASARSGIELAHSVLQEKTVRVILLDETLKGLEPKDERSEIEALACDIEGTDRQIVVVLHSRSNLDCFSTVIDLDK